MTKDEARAAMETALKGARDVAGKAENEDRDLTAEERGQVTDFMKAAKDARREYDEKTGDDELRDQIKQFGDDIALLDGGKQERIAGAGAARGAGKSLGERFVNSDAFTGWMKNFPQGRIPEGAKGISSPPVEFAGFKDLITGESDTSAGALVTPDRKPFVDVPTRPLTIRDLIGSGTTGSDTVEYVRQGTRTNNAAPVAEATTAERPTHDTTTGEPILPAGGGYKPESAFTLEKVTEAVRTIAHWIPATKRALSDAGQIRTLIDNFLRFGLEEELEDQMVTGDGTGENFTGILNTAGTTVQTFQSAETEVGPLMATALKGKTKVRTVGRARPIGYVFNPEDWEKIQLERLRKNPNNEALAGAVPTLHGLPVSESEAFPVGTGMVADFRLAVLWDREQAAVQVSDSHADFFIRNLVAILAELRAAFGVLRPAAFVELELV